MNGELLIMVIFGFITFCYGYYSGRIDSIPEMRSNYAQGRKDALKEMNKE